MPKKQSKKSIELDESQKLEIDETFKSYDKDDTGTIDVKDFKKALVALKIKYTKDEMDKIVKDIEDGGKILYDDFYEVVSAEFCNKARSEDVDKIFALFDVEKKGKITIKDLRRVNKELDEKIPEEELEEMISYTDDNGDGFINKNEFKKILIKTGLL